MKVWMLTQGEYSSYEVVALFTTRELAQEYALACSIKEHEQDLRQALEDLERYEREGSSWDENTIKSNWETWSTEEGRAERNAKEIRDSRRNSLLWNIKHREEPLVMEDPRYPGWYGDYKIEEQELYDMVPVVPSDD